MSLIGAGQALRFAAFSERFSEACKMSGKVLKFP